MRSYARLAEFARSLTLVCMVLLLVTVIFDTLLMPSQGRAPNPTVWIALSLPLVILIPGLVRRNWKTFTWAGFVSMLYFAQAVVALFSPRIRALDMLQVLFSIALFIGALLFVRWRARAARSQSVQ